jgi:N-acetylglucosaminyldiphosphoundecaprenol N-acetyl-beta-D-mannosaminyltransferase
MVVVNAAKAVLAARDQHLGTTIGRADIVTADGMSVVWASRVLGQPLAERVTGIDVFEKLIGRAAQTGLSVFLLGASKESVRAVADRFRAQHPNLKLAGYRDGYFNQQESAKVAEEIRSTGADLLFVAMGSPAQERWIAAHLHLTGVRFALGVGGAFDHLSGLARRAPKWMQESGLEWLYRFLREPGRLWRRYLIGNPVFIWMVIRQLFSRRQQQ